MVAALHGTQFAGVAAAVGHRLDVAFERLAFSIEERRMRSVDSAVPLLHGWHAA